MFRRSRVFFLLCHVISSTIALLSSGVLFPIFIDPGDDCSGWAALNQASVNGYIAANPSLPFLFVVNPNSGPGGALKSQPEAKYQTCIPRLAASGTPQNNVRILGYVATNFGNAASTRDVLNNITTYGNWGIDYRPTGIYFDQANPLLSLFSVYNKFASAAHDTFGPESQTFIAVNPNTAEDLDRFYTIVDVVTTVTDFYSEFSTSQLSFNNSAPASKQAVVLHDAAATTNSSLVQGLVTQGVGYVFITDTHNGSMYASIPSDWLGLCSNISRAANLVDTSSSISS
ncbi:Spherulation-specific family 4 [Mycena floridula]|nr:Spherulation-specific family 4 [Mycena floridula]